jgi:hypothetical protein
MGEIYKDSWNMSIKTGETIEFTFSGFKIKFKYCFENSVITLEFHGVYQFDFCDFEYISETDWEFGLAQYVQSPLLETLYSRVPYENRNRAFGGELYKMQHYKLVIDDVGIYNIICKEFRLN